MSGIDTDNCGCGCCAGVTAATPRRVENRPGLPAVPYRVGRHQEFRESLVAGLTRADRPSLSKLRTRDPDDLTIALLDGFATVCDIITFYTERLAQESYLRTATDQVSMRELGRLVAYRLRPGVAAQTHLAFFVEPPPAVPPGIGPQAAFPLPTMSGAVTIDAGLPVRSVPGPGQQPQTFETIEPVTARAAWNALRARRTRPTQLTAGRSDAYLTGTGFNLRPGDRLLLATTGTSTTGPSMVLTVTGVSVDAVANTTHVTWTPELKADRIPTSPGLYALRPALSVFGHNAPLKGLITQPSSPTGPDWENLNASSAPKAVDVDGSHPEILPNSWLVLQLDTTPTLYRVDHVIEMSRTAFAISGRITRAVLGESTSTFDGTARQTAVLVATTVEPLPLAEEPDPGTVDSGQITVDGDLTGLPLGRTVLVVGTTTANKTAVEATTVSGLAGSTISLDPPLEQTYQRDTVVVYGNVAVATHGETVHQVLGSGDGSRPDQTFELAHEPLTYTQSTASGGATSTLAVTVNDVTWHEAPSLYPAGATDRSFVTRVTETGAVAVTTGDGTRGARLPTGRQNVRAKYRKGIGVAGNVDSGALSQVIDPPLGLTRVTNPAGGVGGADPEGPADARGGIPLSVRTLGRVVSLDDYADYARGYAGIAKAQAAVLPLPAGRTIVVTVAGAGGDPVPDSVRAHLVKSLRDHGDPCVAVQVVPHRAATFAVGLTLTTDEDRDGDVVLQAVRAAVMAAFGFAQRDFVQPANRSELVAVVHQVPGVVACDVDVFYRTSMPVPMEPGWPAWSPLADRLFAARPTVHNGQPVGAELLSIDEDAFNWPGDVI
jgi:hypothetical protein